WEAVDVFGNHGLCGLPEEGAHGKSPKCLDGNLGDFGEFCKGLRSSENLKVEFSDDLFIESIHTWNRPNP
uniref:hypothetical protein n=1 Tax=Neisseria sp. Marseille-Q2251 TaxID=2866585 RepID=UPI00313A21BB